MSKVKVVHGTVPLPYPSGHKEKGMFMSALHVNLRGIRSHFQETEGISFRSDPIVSKYDLIQLGVVRVCQYCNKIKSHHKMKTKT